MILFSHPTGNANVRHAALALHHSCLLGEFWTCLNFRERPWHRLLPAALLRQLRRRANPAALQPYLHAAPRHELLRLLVPHLGGRRFVRHETGRFSVDAVYRALDRRVARRINRQPFRGVYAYEDGAAESFEAAARHGLLACYDLPIGYWRAARAILGEEAELQPAWAATLAGNSDSAEKNARKDAELAAAGIVFVASSFTRRTLELAPAFRAPVVVIPYGAPRRPAGLAARPTAGPGPLRVLFVGSLGQRKGLSYLFAACRMLGRAVQLTVIGALPGAPCAALERELRDVRWLPGAPHAEILAEMNVHDVFVFPSLFEGFGLVLLEAMAMGLPVITTAHTAGPDLIEEGAEGFIVPIRDAGAIAERLALLHSDPERREAMGRQAARRAAQFTWTAYETKLAACLTTALEPPAPTPAVPVSLGSP